MKQLLLNFLLLILVVGGITSCANSDSTSQVDNNTTTPVVVTEPEPETPTEVVSRLQFPPSPESYISQL